jgi:superfamily II DNA or RNA helicase
MVKIIVENTKCQIVGLTDIDIIRELDLKLSYQIQGFQFMRIKNNWDGRYRLLDKKLTFPVGLMPSARRIMKSHGLRVEVDDRRPKLSYGKPLELSSSSGYDPRKYQMEIIDGAWKSGGGIVRAATGCHRIGQGILMYDGTIKKVQDVIVGDTLMGPDSKPRKVVRLCHGNDQMIEIIPTKGHSFVVNKEHILSLKRTKRRATDKRAGEVIDIKVSDWYDWAKYTKHIHKLFRVPVDFSIKKNLKIDPYFMGLLLGDGSIKYNSIAITSLDDEIILEAYKQAERFNCYIRKNKITYYFSKNKGYGKENYLRKALRGYNLIGCGSDNKYIPHEYKTSSKKQRLDILAGLMDSDGSQSRGGFDFISKSKNLANDVAFVARSLGLAAYTKECKKQCHNNGVWGIYYRVTISGDCSIIPNRIKRKKAKKRMQKKNVLVTGFSTKELGKERYYGFQVDKDHRYLLDDFTVTHNSGKTLTIAMISAKFNIKTVIYVIGIELLYQMKDTIEKAYPELDVGMVGDGHCNVQDVTVATIWSAASAFNQKLILNDNDHTHDSARKNKKLNKELVRKMVRSAEMIIVDECQYAASNTVQFLHRESVSARHRFLFSGTPWRDSGDDILIEAVGGPKFYDLGATKLINEGWLVPPKIYFLDVPTKRGIGKTYQEVYQNYIVENKERNDLIVKATKRLAEDGRKTLILVTKVEHGKLLLDLLKNDLRVSSLDGRNKTADRLEAISEMRNGNLDVLIASKIFDQGIDIPELDALVLAGSGKSSARGLQRVGRVIRKGDGKKDAIVVDFYDKCKYLREHSKARKKVYSTEPGFKIIMPKR